MMSGSITTDLVPGKTGSITIQSRGLTLRSGLILFQVRILWERDFYTSFLESC